MPDVEAVFLWAGVWFYGLGFICVLYGVVFGREKWVFYGSKLAVVGFISQSFSMGIRWAAIGHPPVKGAYENSMLGSWFIMALFLIASSVRKRIEVVGAVVIPMLLLMIGNGIFRHSPELQPLSPPYKSNWLLFHIFFAWIAYGAFSLCAGLGILFLAKERSLAKGGDGRFMARFPETNVISNLTIRVAMFGFLALTVEIGAGAIWAYGLWGRYWAWDPIETWSLVSWLIYGTYIHLGVTLGWKGRRMAWLAILALASVFITFGGIGYLGGIHTTIL